MTVLDEADRILDMGFQRTLTALLAHLPKSRQTLLFSATQTESISDLARLSLKDPVPIGVSSDPTLGAATQIPSSSSSSDPSTKSKPTPSAHLPANLAQHFAVVELDKKLDVLWSFIKAHTQAKTLVFLSSCKQVRFAYAAFCKMQPGVPLLHLHGKQRQPARLATYAAFSRTRHAVLVATDIAARGLDFPAVDWVVQVDAPEDAETYIHRVGRTARYESKGKGLLLLCPNEEQGMLAALRKKGVEVERIRIRPSKTQSVKNMLQKFAFQEPEMKYLGQKVRFRAVSSLSVFFFFFFSLFRERSLLIGLEKYYYYYYYSITTTKKKNTFDIRHSTLDIKLHDAHTRTHIYNIGIHVVPPLGAPPEGQVHLRRRRAARGALRRIARPARYAEDQVFEQGPAERARA